MKIVSFKVEIKDLEDKIWRKIEIRESSTLAELAYTIIGTFELFSSEFYSIHHGNRTYDSASYIYDNEDYKSSTAIKLKDLNFSNPILNMEYDFQNKLEIIITYLEEYNTKDSKDYPKIVDGSGKALSFVCGEELKQIVEETDKNGMSCYSITIENDEEEEEEIFDYRDFDIDLNNDMTSCNLKFIKSDYETHTLLDILRITDEFESRFINIDTMEIVNLADVYRKYIPANKELSDEELNKIPYLNDLNIYKLPSFKDLNHKEIMNSYVKTNITDKIIRKDLFDSLKNHKFLDKFYNALRKHGLFKEYIDYSNDYYKEIYKEWYENIKKGSNK